MPRYIPIVEKQYYRYWLSQHVPDCMYVMILPTSKKKPPYMNAIRDTLLLKLTSKFMLVTDSSRSVFIFFCKSRVVKCCRWSHSNWVWRPARSGCQNIEQWSHYSLLDDYNMLSTIETCAGQNQTEHTNSTVIYSDCVKRSWPSNITCHLKCSQYT